MTLVYAPWAANGTNTVMCYTVAYGHNAPSCDPLKSSFLVSPPLYVWTLFSLNTDVPNW